MAIHLLGIPHIKRTLRRSFSNTDTSSVPRGHVAVYVGQSQKKRFVVPLSYLNHPLFQKLLDQAEEEYGFDHPMGALTIPCDEDTFIVVGNAVSTSIRQNRVILHKGMSPKRTCRLTDFLEMKEFLESYFLSINTQTSDQSNHSTPNLPIFSQDQYNLCTCFPVDHPTSMAIRLPGIPHIKRSLRRSLSNSEASSVPRGHVAVYVGETQRKRFVVPLSYLSHPLFQDLLNQAEEEFGYDHPMGGLTIPCGEDIFTDLTERLSSL